MALMTAEWFGLAGLAVVLGATLSAVRARGRANPQPRSREDRERALVARQLARRARR